jgi:hypothetical protein
LRYVGSQYRVPVLGPGDFVPDVMVWMEPRSDPERLKDVLGDGLSLLAFYLWDWSPT